RNPEKALGGDQTGHGIETLLDARLAGRLLRAVQDVRRRNKFSSTRFAPVNAGGQKWLILIISGSR
ncbi:MAG: hypothetical protein WA710_04655, partial [Pseudolabrys sp.]